MDGIFFPSSLYDTCCRKLTHFKELSLRFWTVKRQGKMKEGFNLTRCFFVQLFPGPANHPGLAGFRRKPLFVPTRALVLHLQSTQDACELWLLKPLKFQKPPLPLRRGPPNFQPRRPVLQFSKKLRRKMHLLLWALSVISSGGGAVAGADGEWFINGLHIH